MQMKKLTAEQVKAMRPTQLAKAMTELKEFDPETQQMLGSAIDAMPDDMAPLPGPPETTTKAVGPVEGDPTLESIENVEVEADEPDQAPLGAQVIRSIHGNISSLIETATKALVPVEAPEVKDGVTEILTQMQELATSLEGLFSSKYPDQSGLVAEAVDTGDEVMKSFFAGSNRGRNQLMGLSARVEMISQSVKGGKLSAQHSKLLFQTARELATLNTQAKSFKAPVVQPAAPTIDVSAIEKQFLGIQKQFTTLVETLNGTPVPMPKS